MKAHILFEFTDAPAGGGNQFLKSLKQYLQSINGYEEDSAKADVILLNSHHHIIRAAKLKLRHPQKFFVHRVDGPMRLYNKSNDKRDSIVHTANKILADGTIFQSAWSREQNYLLGFPASSFESIISNAPDPNIFNQREKKDITSKDKIRLIATSLSDNWKKGFITYKWLDDNLDFIKYEMVFIGKTPVEFKYIQHIPPLKSDRLAAELKKRDIFIFASPIESCSNSLLEALHCRLPVIGAGSSSNPALIGNGGETFSRPDEIPELLEKIGNNYKNYQDNIKNPSLEEVGLKYYNLMKRIYREVQAGEYKIKPFKRTDYFKIWAELFFLRFTAHVNHFVGRAKKQNSIQ